MNDLIGIPFPNHSSDVLCSLNEQRRDGLLCDVILIVSDQEYRTHRSVLAACSQYFKKLFTVATTDGGDAHHTAAMYEIDFVAPECLTAILEFAYTSTLTVTASNVKEILNAAQMLEIPCIINGHSTFTNGTNLVFSFVVVLQESMESRALKDFSIESLLQEGLYPRMSTLDRRASFSPLLPGFYPSMWAAEFPAFPQQLLDPGHHQPLDLAVKREIIKEEMKEEVPPSLLHGDFLKEFVSSEGHALGQIKDEADFRSYLSFLSSASHLGALFPPWQLEEERKMKPKASQQCPICNKVIQGAGKLPRHMRTHTGEKPYMCTICEVRFTRQDKLKIHMRKHTGERPYICLHCNSKFVHNYDLKNHLRIHTGVRPYQCEHCYKSFTRSDHLHRHIKRQSCRISRPRRGRKPAAWRSTPNTSFLCPPSAASNRFEQNGLSSAYQAVKSHGLGEMLGLGSRGLGFKSVDGAGMESREERRAEGKHTAEEERAREGRQRGVFAFALAGEEVLTRSPFYAATSDPWTMRLERAPPISESAK
uniref:Zinc finger and BTB domain containing 7C n=1 Tax=Scophthalmus maximus TaxID=52904 RepID=A0A8D2ZXN0_SCOMX